MPGAASPAPRSPRPAKRGLVLPNKLYGSSSKRTPEERAQEIEIMLAKYGAKKIQIVRGVSAAVILFQSPASAGGHFVRIEVPLPSADDAQYAGREGSFIRAARQRWACASLVVKSKLASIVAGIESFESAWLASILLPNGLTVSEWARPQLMASNDNSNDGGDASDDGVLDAEFDTEFDEPSEPQALALPTVTALASPRRLPLAPSDKFACQPMKISVTAGACMRFQGDAGNRATCGSCLVGKDVANRIESAA